MKVAWRRAGEVGRVEAREERSPSSARERTHLFFFVLIGRDQ